jgi:hypothetical protein
MGQGRSTSEMAKQLGVKWDTSVFLQRRLGMSMTRPGLIRHVRSVIEKGDDGSEHHE